MRTQLPPPPGQLKYKTIVLATWVYYVSLPCLIVIWQENRELRKVILLFLWKKWSDFPCVNDEKVVLKEAIEGNRQQCLSGSFYQLNSGSNREADRCWQGYKITFHLGFFLKKNCRWIWLPGDLCKCCDVNCVAFMFPGLSVSHWAECWAWYNLWCLFFFKRKA